MGHLLTNFQVLVVEDEEMIVTLIKIVLIDLGCTSIFVATTVDSALALIDRQHFDAATLDGHLDGYESYPVADKLITRHIPFFFATGNCEFGLRDGYRDRMLLVKPFGLKAMSDTFVRLLAGSRDAELPGRLLPMTG